MAYPNGQASSGVYDIFHGTNFSPNDVVRGIRDNYSPINRTTMLNSLGYQVGLIQNFVNASYLGRPEVPVQNAYMFSGWAEGSMRSYSGLVTEDTHYYAALFPTYADVKSKTGTGDTAVCGHTYIRPYEIEFKYFDAYSSKSGLINFDGISLDHITLTDPDTATDFVSDWRVNKANKLVIANPSATDDVGGFSGILELYGERIELTAPAINLQGYSASSPVNLWFCGSSLTISGGATSANVRIFNNFIPTTDGAKEIGDVAFTWGSGFINGVYSTILSATKTRYNTFIGGVCGATEVWNFDSQSVTGGGVVTARVAASPNKFLLSRATPSVSGYLQINSDGQLEFFKIGSSGWVLTHF